MKHKQLRKLAAGLLVFYGIQFLAGMTLNLFVNLPKSHPGTTGSNYYSQSGHSLIWALSGGGGVALAIHVYIAIGLFFGSLALFIRSIVVEDRLWKWCGGIAAFFTLGALANGLSFVDFGKNVNSMAMATCWLVAVSALVIGLIKSTDSNGKFVKTKG